MKIVVIVPTYNEAENIADTIKTLEETFKETSDHDMSILVTDGNSPDGTADIVRDLQVQYSNIHLIVEGTKRGLGAAYTDAMKHAFEKLNADAVVTFDADLSHDHKLIPQMVRKLAEGYKFISGSRYKRGGGIPDEWAFHRKLLSYGGNIFARTMFFNYGLTDFTSGFKSFTREVFENIKDKIGYRYSGYTFVIALGIEPIRSGFKPFEIPYKFRDRIAGKSKMTSEYFFNAFKFIVELRINDFIKSRLGKVAIAGGGGAVSQLFVYAIFHGIIENQNIFGLPLNGVLFGFEIHPRFLISQLLSIEVGILTAFTINNRWAFGDSRLHGTKLIRGFLKNHLVVTGAIIIQLFVGQALASLFGVGLIQNYIYQIVGILLGLVWNFYFYKRFIWKVK